MIRLKRLTALLLCILMIYPTQGLTAIAGTIEWTENMPVEKEETLPADDSEVIEDSEAIAESDRIDETLPLQPLEDDDYAIYWNPGGKLPAELATASDATASNATSSNAGSSTAAGGKDTADGRTSKTPVKTLEAAIKRAEELVEKEGISASDVTIYAMNPMEIADGELYILNGGNIRIASWAGRSYKSDAVFYVNGGQLTMMNVIIEGRDTNIDPDMTELLYVRGGVLQIGRNVMVNGRIVMDYHLPTEALDWEETATSSDAVIKRKNIGTASFNIDDYILSTDDETLELLTDKLADDSEESTWKDPIIELLEGFGTDVTEYLLEVRMDESTENRELVKTLYADDVSADEFLNYFTLVEDGEEADWRLEVETQTDAQIRGTRSVDGNDVVPLTYNTEILTTKTLIASRSGESGATIYWNPGGEITGVLGGPYPAGRDSGVDGTTPWESFKSWEKAVSLANGGTVICMQPLTLGTGAVEYFGASYVDGNTFTLKSLSLENIVTLKVWSSYERPAIIVPAGTILVLDTVIVEGLEDSGGAIDETMTLHVTGGDLVIENNVTAETGYIQIDASDNLKDRPVVVNSVDMADDGNITLFFGGINNNLNYRYVDVVVPSADLDSLYSEEDKAVLGDALLGRFILHRANKLTPEVGGNSRFSWILQKDTIADENIAEPQKIELYTQYYYDAVYLDGTRGKDEYLGATCDSPVKTWARAKEIWTEEMANSIAARTAAKDILSATEIEKLYPLPKTIYICGTVVVDDLQEWDLSEVQTDYDGSIIKTEILSHIENKDAATLVHSLPKVLVQVVNGGDLTFGKNIFIRNFTGLTDSSTVLVEGTGKFKLTNNAVLTGEKLNTNGTVEKATTFGTHVHGKGGATITFDVNWSGSIEKRGRGLWLEGAATTATMAGGSIQNNDSFDQAAYNAVTAQITGAGVVVEDRATFTMSGGKITENITYQYGAGIYLQEGSKFIMTGGEITANKMKTNRAAGYASNSTVLEAYLIGYGIGIYAEKNTTVSITDGQINKQQAFIGEGVGIWSDGLLSINQSAVNENYTNSTTHSHLSLINKGIGIHVAENGTLQMTDSEVKGNYAFNTNYGNARGIGIYLISNKNNYITDSTISANQAGRAYSNSVEDGYRHSAGGGIYMEGSKLTLTDTVIDGNQAIYGGGIYVKQDSADTEMLTITGGAITNNTGQGKNHWTTGGGGGIFATYTYIRIVDTTIEGNYSRGSGGGIYAWKYCKIEIIGDSSQLLQMKDNTTYNTGGGIYSYHHSILNLDYVEMTGNKAESGGSGGAILSQDYSELTIDNSLITDNYARYEAGGVGAYNNTDTATISNTTIADNQAGRHGGGLYLNGTNVLTDVIINNNKAVEYGGGVALYGHSTLERVSVTNNTTDRNGGGIHYGGGHSYVNPVTLTGRMSIKDSEILNNEATGLWSNTTDDKGRGGGFANWSNDHNVMVENVLIEGNKAMVGGGIANNGLIRIRNIEIIGNEAANGGGIYMWNKNLFLTESKVERNTATVNGGGIYVASGALYFTENRDEGKTSSFTGNEATANGGGIYHSSGHVSFDVAGEIQNRAGEQGSNIYTLKDGGIYVNGTFKQPVPETDAGVYNVYVNVTINHSTSGMILDPSAVKIEAKAGADTDAIYLAAGNSYLSYVKKPDVDTPDMPISLNPDAFEVGSIVVKPYFYNYMDTYKPTADLTGHTLFRITYSPALADAAENLGYNTGGKLPRRTSLARYVDASNANRFNIVLVGEGVYLDGEGGDDAKDGLTPATAVKTFNGAKTRLAEHINDPTHKNGDGFVPFIYICGTVTVPATETFWELDYDDNLFLVDNYKYIESETDLNETVHLAQIRRFASFIRYPGNNNQRPMIRLGNGTESTQLEMGKIIIDGMAEAVITADQGSLSAMVEIMNGSELTLTEWSQLRNNYFWGVLIRENGKLFINGEAPIPGEPHEEEKNKQLLNMHGQFVRIVNGGTVVEMNGYSRILTDGMAQRMGSETHIRAIYAGNIGGNITVHMNDNSSITNLEAENSEVTNPLRINHGIELENNYTWKKEVHLTGEAKIENFVYNMVDNTYAIRVHGGADSNVLLKDKAKIINNNAQYGIQGAANYYAEDEAAGKAPMTISILNQAYVESTRDRAVDTRQTKTIFTMNEDTVIKGYNYGLVADAGTNIVTISDNAKIQARYRAIHFRNAGSIVMSDDTIIEAYNDTQPETGIWSEATTSMSITMTDNASIYSRIHGIRTNANTKTEILMQDHTSVNVVANSGDYGGIYFNERANNTVDVVMRDYATIKAHDLTLRFNNASGTFLMRDYATVVANSRAVYFNLGAMTFTMNDAADVTDDGYASIKVLNNGGNGIMFANVARNARVIMNKNALVQGNTTTGTDGGGVVFSSNVNNNSATDTVGNYLEMKDNSRVTGFRYGLYLHKGCYPINIAMEGNSSVDQNGDGMTEKYTNGDKITKLNLEMSGNARISGNRYYGVYLLGLDNFVKGDLTYHKITLNDDATIGGNGPYAADNPGSGNGYTGIYALSPLELTLNDDSNISWNGHSGTSVITKHAIYFARYYDANNYTNTNNHYRSGTSEITLNDDACIANNMASITVDSGKWILNTGQRFNNDSIITLNGTGGTPAIRDNGTPIFAGDNTTVKLIGTSKLAMADSSKVLDIYGHLILDGRSEIDGQVHMYTSDNPITMTYPVIDTTRKYHLYLAEGYLGKVVVQPDFAGMTDVTGQLPYFVKDGADGLAAPKRLMDESPNIILEGENHVYISGSGNDVNNGNSPATAVRTFKRAKELLETGYFRDGANIIVTTKTVSVLPDDLDWSFDDGGTVTNRHPSGGQTWKPLVIREKNFTGRLIEVNSATAGQVVFEHITIDGGSQEGTILTNASINELLAITRSGSVLLGEGAVLQNNHAQGSISSNTSLGVYIQEGTLEIDGGIIQNMVRESTISSANIIMATAVLATSGNSLYPAQVIFKSGQIRNNEIKAPLASGYDETRFSTIVIRDNYASLEMSGGVIGDNTVATHPTSGSGSRGGAVLFYRSLGEISGGTIRNNTGGIGSAIYYEGIVNQGRLTMSGGQIIDNKTNAPNRTAATELYSPVNVRGFYFDLKGGAADIKDNIYLHNTNNIINLSGVIYQKERVYHIYLNTSYFGKGNVVVQPDKVWLNNASSYLSHFELHANSLILDRGQLSTAPIYSTNSAVKENECLILMKAVFLDSDTGSDVSSNNGSTPSRAVKTFSRAKVLGEQGGNAQNKNYYVIYISGKTTNTNSEPTWTLPATAYMSRYTGFTVYQADGTPERAAPYHEYLIEPAYNLVIDGIKIYGRRSMDPDTSIGNSIVHVKEGIQVVVKESDPANATYLGRNNNNGEYAPPGGSIISLDSKGGVFRVEDKGHLRVEGGTMSDAGATYGSGIYLEAASADQGRLYITGKPVITGSVYLAGNGVTTSSFIETDKSYQPASPLHISVGNDFNGRTVVEYTDQSPISDSQYKYFTYDDSLKALYDIVIQGEHDNFIKLSLKRAYYLDGQSTNSSRDGLTPETAFKDIREVYQAIADNPDKLEGYLVYVVDTVDITAADKIMLTNIEVRTGTQSVYQGTYLDGKGPDIDIEGQVYFKRYSKPSGYTESGDEAADYIGFNKETLMETLFRIHANGELTLNGIYVDGHSVESIGDQKTVVAPAVEAVSPLFTVDTDGLLICGFVDELTVTGGRRTNTKLLNNKNVNRKTNVIGQLNGSDITEGTGGGIELLGGTAILRGTQFSNMKIGDRMAGGEDVYSNGFLQFAYGALFSGTVYLEGFGTAEGNQGTSRYLTVEVYGTPVAIDFQVLMRDPYNHRTVIYHKEEGAGPGDVSQIGRYRLEERVKEFFMLNRREGHPYIFELQLPPAVYIGGPNATDDTDDTIAGSTPSNPVKTLRRAYQLLKTRGGGSIYVVGTFDVDTNVYITGNTYEGDDDPSGIFLGSTNQVKIIRYIQPDFAKDDQAEAIATGYDVEDFTGVMMNVKSGSKAVFSNNVIFDGHSEMKIPDPAEHVAYPKEIQVSRETKSSAPMITVERGGTLELLQGTTLMDNDNEFNLASETTGAAMNGGVLYNSGTALVDGALFTNNHAVKASGVFQDGTFTIKSAPENLAGHTFYLTTSNTEDHVIRTEVAIPDNQIFDIDMDHAVKGRDVVKFLDPSAYDPDVDSEHVHFRLGSTVPSELFLVEAENDPTVLELQNWEILKVEVPTDIYLVFSRRGTLESTTRLKAVIDDPAVGSDLLTAPEYTINNKGSYDARVSISGFTNQTAEVGITADLMSLTATAGDVSADNELYLAVAGLDDISTGTGFGFGETSLQPYAEDTVTEDPFVLGTLKTQTSGNFTFIGAVGSGFTDKYMDAAFPIEGVDKEDVQEYMDGTAGSGVNARAKYLMKYKVEIVPSRRTP